MRNLALSAAIATLCVTVAHADSLDLNLNDKSFAARYTSPHFGSGAQFDLGWLHDIDNGNVGDISFMVAQDLDHNTSGALGLRAAYINGSNHSGYAVGLGGKIEVSLPANDKVKLGAHVFYAPQVLSFGNVSSYTDAGVRVGYQALPRGLIYLGYAYNDAEMKHNYSSATVANGLRVGMDLGF